MKTALAVVDVQSYFVKKSSAQLPARIFEHIENSKYDLVLFTIFKNYAGSNWERSLHWFKCKSDEDAELDSELKKFANKDNIFIKASYSAFKNPQFVNKLQKNQIKKIDICGIDTDACVLATAFDAFDQGYDTKVLYNLCYSSDGLDQQARLIIDRNMQSKN